MRPDPESADGLPARPATDGLPPAASRGAAPTAAAPPDTTHLLPVTEPGRGLLEIPRVAAAHRCTTAAKWSSLVAKHRYSVVAVTPAAAAIDVTVAASQPCTTNDSSA